MSKKQAPPRPSAPAAENVGWNVFEKVHAKDYSTTPFYFTQTSPKGSVRIACWSCDPHLTWDIAEQVIATFPKCVFVLLKVKSEEASDGDPRERYHGADIDKDLVLSTLHRYEDFVLGDASNEIVIRRSDTGEYLT